MKILRVWCSDSTKVFQTFSGSSILSIRSNKGPESIDSDVRVL